jgi:hypothetical protein
MPGNALSEADYKACFAEPMRDVTATAEPVVDIWPYADELDVPELGDVAHVYRSGDARFDHVMIATGRANVFLVIVVDIAASAIHGHRLLDLNAEYGLS